MFKCLDVTNRVIGPAKQLWRRGIQRRTSERMPGFSDAVVDNNERCKRISPPPAAEGIERQTDEDGGRQIRVDERDACFCPEDLISQLLPGDEFAIGESQHRK